MPQSDVIIRRARRSDIERLGRMGATLLRVHYDFDRARFMAPGDDPEGGYAWFLGTQLTKRDAGIFVAERDGTVVGYVYAAIEPQSWKELRDEAGFIHDVLVDETARGGGIASALIDAAVEWLRQRGMPRVVLWTAHANEPAQRLFTARGFRPTMIEMTKELGSEVE
jgi:GNAT superfamily N-acetyltransferase